MSTVAFWTDLLAALIPAAAVLLYACLGELIAERAGVLNLGIEGMMLAGALGGFATTVVTGSASVGFIAGSIAGMALALVHAFMTIHLNANQVVSGLMVSFLGIGLTTFLGQNWVEKSITGFQEVTPPLIGDQLVAIPLVGPALFENTVSDFLAFLLVPVVWYVLAKTNLGLELSSVGRDPETADSLGVPVFRLRYLAVLIGGAFAGAGGAQLSLSFAQVWSSGMTAGRGWIALVLVIFAQWKPIRAMLGSLLFGLLTVFELRSQAIDLADWIESGTAIGGVLELLSHPTIISIYPYAATLALMVWISRRTTYAEIGAPILEVYRRLD